MMFKNSTKLLIANFSIVWKLILYYVLVAGITIGLIAPFFGEIATHFNASGTLSEIGNILTHFNVSVNPFTLVGEISQVVLKLVELAFTFFVANPVIATYLTIVIFYVFPFLLGLKDLPIAQTLFGYMSSLTRYNFVGAFMRLFGRSVRYSLFKSLIMLPFNLLICIVFVLTLKLTAIGGIISYFLPFILVAIILLLASLKKTIFAGWTPAKVVYDCNMFKAFRKGFKAVCRRFLKVFSTALVITLLCAAVNYLFGTFAFPIIIPFFAGAFHVFEMVMFYGSQGMRYYVDLDTIISPKRLEENDSFKKVKNII